MPGVEAAVVTPVEWTILIEDDDCILLVAEGSSSIQVALCHSTVAANALECLDALIASGVLQKPDTSGMVPSRAARAWVKVLRNVIYLSWRYH